MFSGVLSLFVEHAFKRTTALASLYASDVSRNELIKPKLMHSFNLKLCTLSTLHYSWGMHVYMCVLSAEKRKYIGSKS